MRDLSDVRQEPARNEQDKPREHDHGEHGHDHPDGHDHGEHGHDHGKEGHDHPDGHDHGHHHHGHGHGHHGHSHDGGGGIRSALWAELKTHLPFTLGVTVAVVVAIGVISLFREGEWQREFKGAHMMHIFISAIVSSAVAFRQLRNVAVAMSVGIVFSIAFCTFSDAALPQAGAKLFDLQDAHAEADAHAEEGDHAEGDVHAESGAHDDHGGHSALDHFLDLKHLIFTLFFAVVGSFIGMARIGKFPVSIIAHSLHTTLSAIASLLFLLASLGTPWFEWGLAPAVIVTLFISVFLPCVLSDVVMPVVAALSGKRLREKLAG
ncbi:MAG: hypothetical protein OXT69_13730 [Candidatus Poribacteria bacterium]|nr:hypothetical protein [Candidatus Poribacteria bacterium]